MDTSGRSPAEPYGRSPRFRFRGAGGSAPWARPLSALAAGLSILPALAACTGSVPSDEILWDTWGVPHVYGSTEEAVFRGFGWAQARAHGDLVLRLYGQARGRAAEYWGEDYLESDRWVRTMDAPGVARRWIEAQAPPMRRGLEAFVAGFNAWAEEHPDSLDPASRRVLPVEPVDVLAHAVRVLHLTFVVDPGVVVAARRGLAEVEGLARGAAVDSVRTPAGLNAAADTGQGEVPLGRPLRVGVEGALRLGVERSLRLGSNAWAVAPGRSATGNALLVANPHLPWGDLFTWFEAHLRGPGTDVSGATLVGLPVIAVGFNDRMAWTHTVNPFDGADLFAVPVEGDGYRYDGEVRPFEIRRETLRIRGAGGRMRDVPMEVRSTLHGPVVAAAGGRVAALRVAGLDAPGVMEEWWELSRARDLEAFEAALRRLQIPMFNVVYADVEGRVLYVYNGRVPVRSGGDVADWSGVVPGDTSATLWSGVLDYEDLPRVADPPGGWLQNANDPPWTATFPRVLEASDFPSWLAPRFMHFRAQRSAEMLREDDQVDWEELLAYKHSTRMLLADRILDDLLPLAEASGDTAVRAAAGVLEAWDRAADADSRGGVLFLRWVREWLPSAGFEPGEGPATTRARAFARGWDPDRPASTPDGITDPAAALEALAAAARAVREAHGALDVAWGDVHRLRVGDWDLPGNGASGDPGGVFRVVDWAPDGDGALRAVGGDSFVAVVELGEEVRARVLLSYGNWSRPGSVHVGDQLELFARKELRPAWRDLAEVEANLEVREPVPGREPQGVPAPPPPGGA